jgi:flagellar hook assembly protein FlgD
MKGADMGTSSTSGVTQPKISFSVYTNNKKKKAKAATAAAAQPTSTKKSKAKVQAYDQTVFDVINDSRNSQRPIGSLVDKTTSLTLKGMLGKTKTSQGYATENRVDYYGFSVKGNINDVGMVFKAQGAEKATFSSVKVPNDVGYATVEILNSQGKVVASSSANATTDQKNNYQSLRNNKLSLNIGNYTLKVAFASGVPSSKTSQYAVQLFAGTTYTKSYTTLEYAPTGVDTTSVLTPGANAVGIYDAATATSTGISLPSTGTIFDYTS